MGQPIYIIGCVNKDSCKCDLSIEVTETTPEQTMKTLIAGVNESINLNVMVKNTGSEPAYQTTLEMGSNINLPDQLVETSSGVRCSKVSTLGIYFQRLPL